MSTRQHRELHFWATLQHCMNIAYCSSLSYFSSYVVILAYYLGFPINDVEDWGNESFISFTPSWVPSTKADTQ